MSDMSQYQALLREVRKQRGQLPPEPQRPLKKRKKSKRVKKEEVKEPEKPSDIPKNNNEVEMELDPVEESDVTEVKPKVFLNSENEMDLKFEPVEEDTGDEFEPVEEDTGDEFDSDEFENVDLENDSFNLELEKPSEEHITVSIAKPVTLKKTKKNVNIIDKEEKLFRKSFHMWTIAFMACHGLIRNKWISDAMLLESLQKTVPRDIVKNLRECLLPDPHGSEEMSFTEKKIHSRKLLDCLKQLMEFWNQDFIVNGDVGIYKNFWNELDTNRKTKPTTKLRFVNRILKKRGSRDIAAQGFVSLLRSLGLHTRLVFSLQPPDFTNNTKLEQQSSTDSKKPRPPQQQATKNLKGLRPGEKLLLQFRNKRTVTEETNIGSQSIDKESEYPVFWAEVWDKFSQKWISIDAICFKYIEVVRVNSKFEPPTTDERNNAYYVLGYDNDGRVRDITRRYLKNYNAKTRKKRITRDPKGEIWYNKLVTALCSEIGKKQCGFDIKELEYFNRKSLQEGMPNSIQDFKNHPIYVLEEQLKSNEIISPKTPCGRTRKKNSKTSETIPVYKRENVYVVRSAKAWYMRGRILKAGERPMLTKTNKQLKFEYEDDLFGLDDESDGEDTDTRLYAESQTELYIPPMVVDGEVPKNAYGNIDLYVPSMLPLNACYRDSKLASKAAKTLGIDYADACIGFDFSKGGNSTARTKGIVIAKEYEEIMIQLEEELQKEEDERQRKRAELIALRSWRVLLTKLRIKDELNKKYGNIDGLDEVADEQFKKIEAKYAKNYDSDDDDSDIYAKYYDSTPSNEANSDFEGGGGFFPEQDGFEKEIKDYDDYGTLKDEGYLDEESDGGGFVIKDHNGGGFVVEDTADNDDKDEDHNGGGGFVVEDTADNDEETSAVVQDSGGIIEDKEDVSDEEFLYDPALQQALLPEPKAIATSDVESIDSLELANDGIEEDETPTNDNYYDDNEFEYSDDDL